MEIYQGVKFSCKKNGDSFPFDERLALLNNWAWIFGQVGLTPVHPKGAFGNMSLRSSGATFIITKTGMLPERRLVVDNYVQVEDYDARRKEFFVRGAWVPSSECFLHDAIYRDFTEVGCVLHGHSLLFNELAGDIGIPVTTRFEEYGTLELSDSALEILSMRDRIIILRDHGFVAIGATIADAGKLVLEKYCQLFSLLGNRIPPA